METEFCWQKYGIQGCEVGFFVCFFSILIINITTLKILKYRISLTRGVHSRPAQLMSLL